MYVYIYIYMYIYKYIYIYIYIYGERERERENERAREKHVSLHDNIASSRDYYNSTGSQFTCGDIIARPPETSRAVLRLFTCLYNHTRISCFPGAFR